MTKLAFIRMQYAHGVVLRSVELDISNGIAHAPQYITIQLFLSETVYGFMEICETHKPSEFKVRHKRGNNEILTQNTDIISTYCRNSILVRT